MSTSRILVILISVLLTLSANSAGWPGDSARFRFSMPAKGGQLHVVNKAHASQPEVGVLTTSAQPIEEVSNALQDALLRGPLAEIMFSVATFGLDRDSYRERWLDSGYVTLEGFRGEVVLGGTETGLGILPPVGSVSVSHDANSNAHTFFWHEKSDYDELYVCHLGAQGGRAALDSESGDRISVTVPGNTRFESERRPYYVVGFKNGLPTNASHIIFNKVEQIDYFFHPFTGGIATNWTGWSTGSSSPIQFEERAFSEGWQAPAVQSLEPYESRCAQVLRCEEIGGAGGIYRFFIAQEAGRVYRPALRYQVLSDPKVSELDWSFDVMMGTLASETASELDFATRVLDRDVWTELESRAGETVRWRVDQTSKRVGEWVLLQTGEQDGDIERKDLILGSEKTAVFFCVRLSGAKPSGIALDGVRLVDVTDGFLNEESRKDFL